MSGSLSEEFSKSEHHVKRVRLLKCIPFYVE